jgi:hypothetical protein
MNAKKAVAEATIAGALAISALGLGGGVANASTPAPSNIPSVQCGNKTTAGGVGGGAGVPGAATEMTNR